MPSVILAGTTSSTALNLTGDTSGDLQFQTNNGSTTAMTLTTAGNVGIGTASPSTKLHVSGSGGDIVTLTKCTGGGGGGIFRADGDGAGSYPGFQTSQSGTNYWTIGQRGDTNIYINREAGSGRVIVPTGSLQVATTIGVGGATPAASGAGITFPATQSASSDANTLDDYEEGTWTPTIVSQTGSITSYTSTGQYTKIGRNVFLTFTTTLTNVGTAGGRLQFSNLPFTALNLSGGRPAVFVGRENAATGIPVVGWLDGSQTTGEIASLSFTAITWTNNYQYTMSVTYQSTQ